MNNRDNSYAPQNFGYEYLKLNITNWDDFIEFINEFEQTDEELSNLDGYKINQYYTLYLKKQEKQRRSVGSNIYKSVKGKTTLDHSEKPEEHIEYTEIEGMNEEEEEIEDTFEYETKNQVKISDIFEDNIEIVVETLKKGGLFSSSNFVIRTSPVDPQSPNQYYWTTERSFNDIQELFAALKTSYPNCIVSSLDPLLEFANSRFSRQEYWKGL